MSTFRLVALPVAFAIITACGSSYNSTPSSPTPTPTPTPTPSGTSVTIPVGARTAGSAAYAPNPVSVAAGTTVTWTNSDTIAHTATSDSNGVFDSGSIAAGGKFSFTFNTRGTFNYHCTFHTGMVGTVVVQ